MEAHLERKLEGSIHYSTNLSVLTTLLNAPCFLLLSLLSLINLLSDMFSKWRVSAFGLCVLAAGVAAEDLTWWVDQSCETRLGAGVTDRMMQEAVDTVLSMRHRMQRTKDQEGQAYAAFQQVFKFDPSTDLGDPLTSSQWNQVRGT